ncbi:long-chain-fatty-acid--CoA ligase [Azospirillum doebereinerae]|uniref:long-chain-fatty-acid--CoA ligase n=1 Tax=Azospirillum doebereinerae TaxID=92933 RepID=UPI0030846BFA
MQDVPLMISSLLDYAATNHPDREIVSRMPDGSIHRYGYADAHDRAKRLAKALLGCGIRPGDRIATLATNSFRHFECFYGVSGIGAVLHTVNPRLFETQIDYIVTHAEDRVLFVDLPYMELAERIAPKLACVERWVVMCDRPGLPATSLPGAVSYEDFLHEDSDGFDWPEFDERSASSLCYTSGTTGHPKGVLYSHRSTLLHAMHAAQPSVLGISPAESLLVIAPMYHANAWSTPYLAPMTGAKLILPGIDMSARNLHELLTQEKATFACAVPTVWTTLLQYVEENGFDLGGLTRAAIAGVAVPPAMIQHLLTRYGVSVLQFWGMTEMSPIATISTPIPAIAHLAETERLDILCKQGRIAYGVKLKIVNQNEERQPRDGKSFGDIRGKGPWIADGYFKGEGGNALDEEGWLPTGDVGFMDPYGYLKLTDRTKDVIKSGGEWVSSIDLENAAISHPAVQEAAVVGVFHPKWDERPLLILTLRPQARLSKDEILDHLRARVAKWWLPDDVVVVDKLPYTATGKIRKADLRHEYRYYLHPQTP